MSYLWTFGCRAWVLNDKGKKWDPKSSPMIFVGYEPGANAFRLWNPKTRTIVISANVRFSEHEFPNRPAAQTPTSVPTSSSSKVNSPDWEKWDNAMAEEYASLAEHGTWEVVPHPEECHVIDSKWVYRIKYDADGNISHYKAQLVACGFTQVFGVDYTETFTPVTCLETLRLLFALAVEKDWEVRQIDVKTAYLYGDLDEVIYMQPPEGAEVPEGHIFLLRKALYGLKQAGCQWYKKLKDTMAKFGLTQAKSDPHTFVTHKIVDGVKRTLILPIYVDDLFPIGDKVLTDDFEKWIGSYFTTTEPCDANYFLGICIKRKHTLEKSYISLDQESYINTVLARVIPANSPIKEYETPLPTVELVPNLEPKELANPNDVHDYQSTIRQLMYIMLGTRPDLAYAVGKLSHFSSNPSADHMYAVVRTFGYLKKYAKCGLVYRKDDNPVYGYTDSDWAGETATAKSTSGYVFFLSKTAFSWSSKQQEIIAASTMEAEYIGLFHASRQAVWIARFLEQIGFPLAGKLEVKCDNEATITVANSADVPFKKAKHLNTKYHIVQDFVKDNQIAVTKVSSEDNLADQLMKVLPHDWFYDQSSDLGLESIDSLDHSSSSDS